MQAEQNAQLRLKDIEHLFVRDEIPVNTKIIHGVAASEGIMTVANEVAADLIIMGSHGHTGFKKMVLGSVAQNVLMHSHIPVLIVKV